MILSKYNIYVTQDDFVTIYNTLTGGLIQLSKDKYDSVLNGSFEEIGVLLRSGIVIENENDDFHKYKYIQHSKMFSRERVVLYICPTMKCNFSCFYCFEGNNKHQQVMTDEVENSIVEYLYANKNKKISIIWFGGEPMLNFNRILSLSRKLEDKQIDFTSSMITNGSLLTQRNVNKLNELNLEFIQISLDGVSEDHNTRRYFPSKLGSFDVITDGINRVLENTDIPITIQVAVDKSNYSAYEDVLNYFNAMQPLHMQNERIHINYNIVGDRTNFDSQKTCFNGKEHYDFLMHLKQTNIKNKVKLFLPGMSSPCMYVTSDCYAIAPNGDMYKCLEHLGDKNKSVGNLTERTLLLNKLSEMTFSYDSFSNNECRDCAVFPICGGGCPLDRQKEKGANGISCSFYKEHISDILSLIKTKT